MEDLSGASWWQSLLTTLSSTAGSTLLRFVGRVDGRRRYVGRTFSTPRTLGELPPRDAWAPEMSAALTDLEDRLVADGWTPAGRGSEPWDLRFERIEPAPDPAVSRRRR